MKLPSAAPRAPEAPRPVPWPVVGVAVAVAVALLLALTVGLPLWQSARQGDMVHVQDLTLTLTAQPDLAYEHGVDLEVTVSPAPGDDATVQMAVTMPTMANMPATSTSVTPAGLGPYRVTSDLGMAGLWQVEVRVRRPDRPPALGYFRLNA